MDVPNPQPPSGGRGALAQAGLGLFFVPLGADKLPSLDASRPADARGGGIGTINFCGQVKSVAGLASLGGGA